MTSNPLKSKKSKRSRKQAKCIYCHELLYGIPEQMLRHLNETCEKIEEEIRDTLSNIKITRHPKKRQNANSLKQSKNKSIQINTSSSEEDNDINQSSTNTSKYRVENNNLIHCQLLRALISANVLFSFVENEEVRKLFKMVQPLYTLPSRRWISTEILDKVHDEVETEVQKFVDDSKFLTLSGDGWTNVTKHSSNMVKARKMVNEDPELQRKIITIPCMAHQTNLLVKKIIKSKQFEPIITMMLSVINHFRNSNHALAKLRELEKNEHLSLQYPYSDVLTIKGNESHKIINIIENVEFWTKLDAFLNILKPYDYVIKILESDKVTLGHISATWVWLRKINDELPADNFLDFKSLMLSEIDNRWAKIYDSTFLITWFLHPYYRGKGIREEKFLQIQEDAYSLFCLLYPEKDHDTFVDEWLMYQNYENIFDKNSSLNRSSITKLPLRYWRTILVHVPNLAEFACRLFSIPPNSATSERVWSLMGNIHTERRNRLSVPKTAKMTKIAWYLKEQVSSQIIDDIENLDPSNRNNLPVISLFEFFNPQLIQQLL
ncbi:24039_t:CDS:2, partial [Racocetra persica]